MVKGCATIRRTAVVSWIVMSVLSVHGAAQQPDAPPERDTEHPAVTLEEVTPTYSVALRPPHLSSIQPEFPVSVLGYDLRQSGKTIQSHPPTVDERAPYEFTVYWHVHGLLPPELTLQLRLDGTGPLLAETFPVAADGWQPGGVYHTTHLYANRGSRYAGDATLRLGASRGDDTDPAPLFVGPFHITPGLSKSRVSAARLEALFGSESRRLNVATRLGAGARVTVPIDPATTRSVVTLGILAACGYNAFFDQGAVIAEIECRTEDGNVLQRLRVRYGVHTAHSDYDKYPAGRLAHEKTQVFSSRHVPATDTTPAFARHLYVGQLPLSSPAVLTELEIAYQPDDGVLDIQDIVLISR